MSRYFVRRILETIPLMLIISIFVFMFIHLIPGDPARSIAGLDAEEWEVEAIREEYGLNKPIVTQYVDYMVKLFHGDMGRSMKSDTPVTELIADRMPQTLKLVFAGVIWAPGAGHLYRCHLGHQARQAAGPHLHAAGPSPACRHRASGWA